MHVGAPVREAPRFVVSDIRLSASSPCRPSSRARGFQPPSSLHLSLFLFTSSPSRPLLYPFLSSISGLFLPLSFRSPRNLRLRLPDIGRLVLTRLIQMNRGLSDVSRRTNWILEIKKRGPLSLRELTETHGRARSLSFVLFFFGVPSLRSVLTRSRPPLMLASSSYRSRSYL